MLLAVQVSITFCYCAGSCELAAALTPSAPLRTLDMNENGIGEKGAAALAEALQAGSQLHVLRLRGNVIGDKGAAALGRALATEPVLEELDVGHNEVGLLGRPPPPHICSARCAQSPARSAGCRAHAGLAALPAHESAFALL